MLKRRGAIGLALMLLLGSQPLTARADGLSPDDIVKALTPKPKALVTRGLSLTGVDATPAAQAVAPPQVDLTVNFDFNSAHLTPEGVQMLGNLGVALNDPNLKTLRFRIVGHTDARGGPDYNLALSQRRAEAVGAYLNQTYGVDAGRLDLQGRGAAELKDPDHPEDGVNRRVQVVTLTQ